jgi:cellulose synthase/poly-beta-1,6-N-acetylglucosamine synthase-like glycosyltransferase
VIFFLVLVALFLLAYGGMVLYFSWLWGRLNSQLAVSKAGKREENKLLSVVVVFRNEAGNLPKLIADFIQQDLPQTYWEILWVDDFSEDESLEIVKNAQNSLPNSHILKNDTFSHILSPKKRAITQAISRAEGKWIVCTDADCRVPSSWLSAILEYLEQTDVYFVSMPVRILAKDNFFQQWQAVEFASLIGTGAACIALHKPTMCNGANIAYKKTIFERVGGFAGSEHIPSGDDEFLMHKIATQFPQKVQFLKSQAVLVSTQANENWKQFFHQRKRWASKWEHYQNSFTKMLAVFIFLANLSVLVLPFWIFEKTWVVLGLLVFKFVAEFVFLTAVLRFFQQKKFAFWIPFLFVLYPIYAVFFALISRLKSYEWKSRHYERT